MAADFVLKRMPVPYDGLKIVLNQVHLIADQFAELGRGSMFRVKLDLMVAEWGNAPDGELALVFFEVFESIKNSLLEVEEGLYVGAVGITPNVENQ